MARPPSEVLLQRLRALGFQPVRLATHRNRTILFSHSPTRGLRIHEGFALAPDRVLHAIVRFLRPRASRAERAVARQIFLSFPVPTDAAAPPHRPERPRPGDAALLDRLAALHAELNARHFDGRLGGILLALSGRMRSRLGEIALKRGTGRPLRITISRRHIARDGWAEVAHTLLHEMVHQWQAETGAPVDHGPRFRHKAREVGIAPLAVRAVGRDLR